MNHGSLHDDALDDALEDFDTPSRGGSVLGRVVGLVALATVLSYAWRSVSGTRQRRVVARSAPLPERLQTWEGEGGRPDPEPIAGSVHSSAAGRTVSTAAPGATTGVTTDATTGGSDTR